MNKGMEGHPLMMSPACGDKDATSLSTAVTMRHFLSPTWHYAPADVIPPLVIRRRGRIKQAPFRRNELGCGLEEPAIISWASEHGKGFQPCPKPSHPPNARAFKRKKQVLKEHSFSRGPGCQLLHTYDKVTWHFVFSVYQMLHFPEKNKGQFSTKEHQPQD